LGFTSKFTPSGIALRTLDPRVLPKLFGTKGNTVRAAIPAPNQSLFRIASYVSLIAIASPTGVILAASSRSTTGFSPLTNGLPSNLLISSVEFLR
jgi:hypothetical protein